MENNFEEAIRRGEEALRTRPRAVSVSFDPKTRRVMAELNNGATLVFPVSLVKGLESATDEQLSRIEILGPGWAIVWTDLDVDLSLTVLMSGTCSPAEELGRSGGSVRSDQKTRAARENGRKGGRPRKTAAR